MGVKHALVAACALLAGTSCLLPEYAPSGTIDCSGDKELEPFAKVLGSNSWAEVSDLDGDPCAEMYVTGYFDNDVRFESSIAFDGDWVDGFIGRMQPDGTYEWVRKIHGTEEQWARHVASLPDGAAVGGDFEIELAFESQPLFAPGIIDQFHGYVLKVTGDGSLAGQVWLSTDNDVDVDAVVASRDGRVAVGGSFRSRLTLEGSGIALSNDGMSLNGYVVVFDSQLVPLWHVHFDDVGEERVTDLAFADDGRLYVTGTLSGEPFWEAYSQGGMAENGEYQMIDVGGGVQDAFIVPLAGNERVHVFWGGNFIDDGTMEWPLDNNIGAMRVGAQGAIQWHFEVPDLEGMEGISPEVHRVQYDAPSGYVHISGMLSGGQGKVVQENVIKTLDPKPEPDAMLLTFHVDDGFRNIGLFGDDLPQSARGVFGGGGQVLLGGDYEGVIDFPSGNRVATQSPPDGYLVRFPWAP